MLKLSIDEFTKFQEAKIMKSHHYNEALIEKVIEQIWNIQGSLYGLGALFKTGYELSFNADEAFGIGQCLQTFSVELAKLEDILKNDHREEDLPPLENQGHSDKSGQSKNPSGQAPKT